MPKLKYKRLPRRLGFGYCTNLTKDLTEFDLKNLAQNNFAVFVPESRYKKCKMPISIRRQFVADEHIWDYNHQIGDKITKMKLIWITRNTNEIDVNTLPDLKLKNAFSFLQPNFLRYMDKPFWNPNAITQVNLVLDYHRRQKRENGNEIFNICDLINFKMAIDDNRYEYENCEFHKIIDRSLAELVKYPKYITNGQFIFNKYFEDINYYTRPYWEMFHYLMYHFKKTFAFISIQYLGTVINLTTLSKISNIPFFLKTNAPNIGTSLEISNTDASGKCSEVLYELLANTDVAVQLEYKTDGEWSYSGDNTLNKIIKPLNKSWITITTPNSCNFIENFINWLKLSYGEHSKQIDLTISTIGTINPYILNGFYVDDLCLKHIELNERLIRMLKLCKYSKITFDSCKIGNDLHESFYYIESQPKFTNNIFVHLEEFQNLGFAELLLDDKVIETLFTYVASTMMKNNLKSFRFKNNIWLGVIGEDYMYEFRRSNVNTGVDKIEMYSRSGIILDFYENYQFLFDSDREEYDFYE